MIDCAGLWTLWTLLDTFHDIIIVDHSNRNWAEIAYSPFLRLEHDTASQPFDINFWSCNNSSVDQGREGILIVTIHQILNYKKRNKRSTHFIVSKSSCTESVISCLFKFVKVSSGKKKWNVRKELFAEIKTVITYFASMVLQTLLDIRARNSVDCRWSYIPGFIIPSLWVLD